MDEIDTQIQADYERDKSMIRDAATVKGVYSLAWLRGRQAGLSAGMEFAVIGEHVNEPLLEAIRETQRQTS